MTKLFYDHLVIIEDLFIEVEELEVTHEEKLAMKKMIDEIIQHQLLTHILDLLPKEDHEVFLERFHHAPYDTKHLQFLEEKIDRDMHAEIIIIAQKAKDEIRKEIKKHKKKKK